ncbi:hypothetical protein L1987_08955 [Smallanthus sonchifolius]|uniref:Uncharacterized protein n=1 Tax=Smallanthus sonchifolius TaxID=185202 RepID=A0ACB9JNX3_9ASTR|nr:hypothetical protein L1987_08955 [Smallanthus sonchifolius]
MNLPFLTRLTPRVPDPVSSIQNAPSTSQDVDVSSIHDHSSGDAVIDQTVVDNSTTILTDQMPIIDLPTPENEDVSESHEAECKK